MSGWTKLFASITESSIWTADDKTLRVWIAMLARSNASGVVEGSVPGFASLCRMSVRDFEACVDKLTSPDPYSRTTDHEGRRLSIIQGGWLILNYTAWREKGQDKEGSRASYYREYRKRRPVARNIAQQSNVARITEAEAEAEADKYKDVGQNDAKQRSAVASPASDEEWLQSLTVNPAYAGLDVRREFQKMTAWCEVNRKQPSRRRLINWLNRAERPMNRPKQGGPPGVEDYR